MSVRSTSLLVGVGATGGSMRVILIAIGSLGDTLPFLALGKALLRRGHEVILGGNSHYANVVERHGLQFEEVFSAEDYQGFLENYRRWTLRESVDEGTRLMRLWMEKSHQLVLRRNLPGTTVVASVGCAFGARIAQETLGIPLATVHLQPMWMRSVSDGTCLPPWFPRPFFRLVEGVVDVLIDGGLGKVTNAYRETLGLPPVKRLMRTWWHSPQLVLNLFPEWFSAPQPDWPTNTACTGFPRTDDLHDENVPEVEKYLAAGEPPLVFAQSSIGKDEGFFEVSRQIASRLGRRAILVTPKASATDCKRDLLAIRFLRLDHVLHRCSALIHHGGIGTIASALTAGVCQLTIPTLPDQFDNARRLERLGVSKVMKRKEYTADHGARVLSGLLNSKVTNARCRHFSALAAADDGLSRACDALERLLAASTSRGVVAFPLIPRGHSQPDEESFSSRNLVMQVDQDRND
ncbi:MAG: glycosyltransferase [Planctomycetota bacterium]